MCGRLPIQQLSRWTILRKWSHHWCAHDFNRSPPMSMLFSSASSSASKFVFASKNGCSLLAHLSVECTSMRSLMRSYAEKITSVWRWFGNVLQSTASTGRRHCQNAVCICNLIRIVASSHGSSPAEHAGLRVTCDNYCGRAGEPSRQYNWNLNQFLRRTKTRKTR